MNSYHAHVVVGETAPLVFEAGSMQPVGVPHFQWVQAPNAASLSPNGLMLAFGGNTTFRVVDFRTGALIFSGPAAAINDLSFSRDNQFLAVANNAGGCTVYSTATWTIVRTLHTGAITACAFSPTEDKLVLGGTTAPRLNFYDTTDWSVISTGISTTNNIDTLRISRDGTLFFYVDSGWLLRVHSMSTWAQTNSVSLGSRCHRGAISPNNAFIGLTSTTTNPRTRLIRLSDNTSVTLGNNVNVGGRWECTFSPDSTILYAPGTTSKAIYQFSTATGAGSIAPMSVGASRCMITSASPVLYEISGTTRNAAAALAPRDVTILCPLTGRAIHQETTPAGLGTFRGFVPTDLPHTVVASNAPLAAGPRHLVRQSVQPVRI